MLEEIYHLDESGRLEAVKESQPCSEDNLQELIAKHPELLSGRLMDGESQRRWILVTREQGIARNVDEGYHWSLDHLLIDQDAVPTLVETKLSTNPEIRRKIVGQMMDYAAHATKTWNQEEIRGAFVRRCALEGLNPTDEMAILLDSEDEIDAERFWDNVEANLRAGSLRLLFVSDSIPNELARVVEFLNSQMSKTGSVGG